MADMTIMVCDADQRPAVERVPFKVGQKTYQKDFCQKCLDKLVDGAVRKPRGRQRIVQKAPA
jgi:hypothetical protein